MSAAFGVAISTMPRAQPERMSSLWRTPASHRIMVLPRAIAVEILIFPFRRGFGWAGSVAPSERLLTLPTRPLERKGILQELHAMSRGRFNATDRGISLATNHADRASRQSKRSACRSTHRARRARGWEDSRGPREARQPRGACFSFPDLPHGAEGYDHEIRGTDADGGKVAIHLHDLPANGYCVALPHGFVSFSFALKAIPPHALFPF